MKAFLPVVLVELRLFNSFVLGPAVLEPDFDLRLRQREPLRQFKSPRPRNVLGAAELQLQSQRLLRAESGALPTWSSALFAPPPRYCQQGINIWIVVIRLQIQYKTYKPFYIIFVRIISENANSSVEPVAYSRDLQALFKKKAKKILPNAILVS